MCATLEFSEDENPEHKKHWMWIGIYPKNCRDISGFWDTVSPAFPQLCKKNIEKLPDFARKQYYYLLIICWAHCGRDTSKTFLSRIAAIWIVKVAYKVNIWVWRYCQNSGGWPILPWNGFSTSLINEYSPYQLFTWIPASFPPSKEELSVFYVAERAHLTIY